jgi:hypothetical protein
MQIETLSLESALGATGYRVYDVLTHLEDCARFLYHYKVSAAKQAGFPQPLPFNFRSVSAHLFGRFGETSPKRYPEGDQVAMRVVAKGLEMGLFEQHNEKGWVRVSAQREKDSRAYSSTVEQSAHNQALLWSSPGDSDE